VVLATRTLVALSVGEKGAMPLNPMQLNGREAVPSLDCRAALCARGPSPAAAHRLCPCGCGSPVAQ